MMTSRANHGWSRCYRGVHYSSTFNILKPKSGTFSSGIFLGHVCSLQRHFMQENVEVACVIHLLSRILKCKVQVFVWCQCPSELHLRWRIFENTCLLVDTRRSELVWGLNSQVCIYWDLLIRNTTTLHHSHYDTADGDDKLSLAKNEMFIHLYNSMVLCCLLYEF